MFQAFGFRGYFLSVVGGVMTMSALLVMTDWQAISYDSCTELSIFHNPNLVGEYRMQLLNSSAKVDSFSQCSILGSDVNYLAVYVFMGDFVDGKNVDCVKVSECPACNESCMEWVISNGCLPSDSTNSDAKTNILCHSEYVPVSCSIVKNYSNFNDTFFLAEVHLQSLKVVRDNIYDLAVEKCEEFDQCHWIPNSYVTHHHCADCQPICRNTHHTLNFVQFTVGLTLLMCTMEVMYIGMFLLLSDSVSKEYQVAM